MRTLFSLRNLLLLIAILFLAGISIGYRSALLSFVEVYLSLTAHDMMMIVLVAVLFFFFWKSMEKYFFLPLLALLEEREELTAGTLQSAESLSDEEKNLRGQIEGDIRKAYKEAELRERELLAALQARNLLEEEQAKKEAKFGMEKANFEVEEEVRCLREQSQRTVATLGRRIIEKISAPLANVERER